MPYDIWSRNGKYEVHKRKDAHILGTHDTKESALKQIRAIYAEKATRGEHE